jgi:Uma2 family endonuclease
MTMTIEQTRTSWQGVGMSVEEFLALPDDGVHRELIYGSVREERDVTPRNERGRSVTIRNRFHSRIEARICYLLIGWLLRQPEPRGEVVCGEAGFRLRGTVESLVGVDVAVVSAELVAATGPKEKIFHGAPVLAVEILSPSDTHEDIVEMVTTYLETGTVVWVVDPDFETVAVHQPGRNSETFHAEEEISDAPYLPGFRAKVAAFFA